MKIKIKRLIAAYIDFILIFSIGYFLLKPIDYLVSGNVFFEVLIGIVGLGLYYLIFTRKDVIIGYESIGKKITRLKVFSNDGIRITDKNVLKNRVLYSITTFPLYPLMILLDNKSEGDKRMHTIVR